MVARGPRAPDSLIARSWDVLARELLLSDGSWSVHSVFQRAINLIAPNGDLLGVVLADGGNGPASLVVQPTADLAALDQLLSPADTALTTNELLIVGDRLAVDLSGASLWSPPPIRLTLPIDQVAERIVQARARGAVLAPNEGFGPLLTDSSSGPLDLTLLRASTLIDNLSTAIRARRWEGVRAAARALSGLGPGLTPAGDDVLAGLALGIRAGLGTLPEPLAEALHNAVEGRTTDLAVARVRHAVAGRPDETVHGVLTAMVGGSVADLDPAVRALIEFGHSSGADTLVGIDRGLRLGVALLLEDGST